MRTRCERFEFALFAANPEAERRGTDFDGHYPGTTGLRASCRHPARPAPRDLSPPLMRNAFFVTLAFLLLGQLPAVAQCTGPPPPPPPPNPGTGLVPPPFGAPPVAGPAATPAASYTPGDASPSAPAPSAATIPGIVIPSVTSPPSAAQSVTGGADLGRDEGAWLYWWELNQYRFLEFERGRRPRVAITGEGSVQQGLETVLTGHDPQQALRPVFHDQVTPVLASMVEDGNRTYLPSVLRSWARIGERGDELHDALSDHLDTAGPAAEAATLSCGYVDSPAAYQDLLALLQDTSAGRAIGCGEARVATRQRAYAAYALGLFAASGKRAALSTQLSRTLLDVLEEETSGSLDLQVACVLALGLLDVARPEKLIYELQTIQADDSRHSLVRAHAVTSAARLAARSNDAASSLDVLNRCRRLLADRSASAEERQSAAQALGMLGGRRESAAGRTVETLRHAVNEDPNRQVRNFALVSLGFLGGELGPHAGLVSAEVLPFLVRQMEKGATAQRPWAALSLGVLAAEARSAGHGELPDSVGRAVTRQFKKTKSPVRRGAYAIGLGLMRFEEARESVHKAWHDSGSPEFLGPCSVAMAMLGEEDCRNDLAYLIENRAFYPTVVRDAAVGLALLRDETLTAKLVEGLDSNSLPKFAACSYALGLVADPRAIPPLVERLSDDDEGSTRRAAAAEALGALWDRELLQRRNLLAADLNYNAAVPTLIDPRTRSGVLDQL